MREPWKIAGTGILARRPPRLDDLDLTPAELAAWRSITGGAGMIDAVELAVLDHVFSKATYTPPATWYLGLSTTTPTDAGGNFTEPSSGSYARKSIASSDWASATGTAPAVTTNANVISMVTATGDWSAAANMTHWGLFAASGGGTVQIWGALDTARPVLNGDTPTAPVGLLRIQLGDPGDTYA